MVALADYFNAFICRGIDCFCSKQSNLAVYLRFILTIIVMEEKKFGFGNNWKRYLPLANQERLEIAIQSIKDFMEVDDLSGKLFVDVGCGSGFFSLAAHKLGAKVISFDVDKNSVSCCETFKTKEGSPDNWKIYEGSILDVEFLKSLPKADIVYSYGVLHHSGNLKQAMENIKMLVGDNGYLLIAIYNTVYGKNGSKAWEKRKKNYMSLPKIIQWLLVLKYLIRFNFVPEIIHGVNPIKSWREYYRKRGESKWVDAIDWVGGYPYEYLRPDEVFNFYKKDFNLVNLLTKNTLALNAFLFKKIN